jgi:hypothetical protein
MFKQLNITLCFLLFSAFGWTSAQDNFKVFVPEFISSSGSFEVSIITSKKYPEADRLIIYILPDFSLNINKVELWTHDIRLNLPAKSEFIVDYSEQFQKFIIDFSDTSLFSEETYFQVILTLKSAGNNSNVLKFFGEFVKQDEILGYLENSDDKIGSDIGSQFKLTINYYEKYLTAGYAGSLVQNSYLNVPLTYGFEDRLSVEFWLKAKNFHSTFLKIINWETNWIEYYLSINENQMLVFNSKDIDWIQINPIFISQRVWYHFNFNFDKQNNELTIFCNQEEVAAVKINSNVELDNLVLHFQNDQPSGEINLEQIRLVNINDSFTSISRNRNYTDYSDDSSNVIFQMSFTETELGSLLNEQRISYEGIKLVKSDAPIFPRAPEIGFNLMNNYYEIEWKVNSYEDARYYIVEKAVGNNQFAEIGKLTADNNEVKKYSLLAEKSDNSEILYFRIKQINKDGSEVYSEVIKIGLGNIEDVVIGQNYPNPFNPATLIEFELLIDSDVEVKVYDLAGKEIAVLHSGFLNSGIHKLKFDATGYPSGIYLYQIITPHSSKTRKMILAK